MELELLKKGAQAIGKSVGGHTTKLHAICLNDRIALTFMLSPGNHHDAPEGVRLLQEFGKHFNNGYMIMDRAYEGKEVRDTVEEQGLISVVPPKKNRKEPWQYDKTKYKKRNYIERLFRRVK